MEEYKVRTASISDVVDIVRIANQAFLEIARLPGSLGHGFVVHMKSFPDWIFVAERTTDRKVIGFLIGSRDKHAAKISWIAVHPEFWGRGIGGMLLHAIEEKARSEGLRIIETGTPFARSFYEKYGFHCINVQKAYILEIAGRKVESPSNIEIRFLFLFDLSELAQVMSKNNYLNLLESYFSALKANNENAILGLKNNQIVGVVIGQRDSLYRDLMILRYLYSVKQEYAPDLLHALIFLSSVKGYRWIGVKLPLFGIEEQYLRDTGWNEARLPSFWTRYWMRKDLG